MTRIDALIFDLDGVITDTSELHYLAWKRLADEEGIPFDREVNERLRGVARRASLEIILAQRPPGAPPPEEAQILAMMERKNGYYVESLATITPENLLPGALELMRDARAAGIKVALGSASKNAPTVLASLGIADLFDVVADGSLVDKAKPAPDIFLRAAELLEVPPAFCVVVEDAAAGVDAALAAGMWAIGLGPAERVGHAHAFFPDLAHVTPADLYLALEDAAWRIHVDGFDPERQAHRGTVFTTGNGYVCVRGALEERLPGEHPASFIHRLWDDMPISMTELANIPRWHEVELWVDGRAFSPAAGRLISHRRELDLRTGLLSRTARWQAVEGGPIIDLRFARLCSMARPHVVVVTAQVSVVEGDAVELRLRTGFDHHVENTGLLHWTLEQQDQDVEHARLLVRTRATGIPLGLTASVTTEASQPWRSGVCDGAGQPSVERRVTLSAGESITIEKYVGVVTVHEADDPWGASLAEAEAARTQGYAALRAESDAAWRDLWEECDIVIEGDIEAQIAQRFNTFHLLIAAPAHTERASIGAKTLSGFGYRHHVFWDTEIFILPIFTYTQTQLARNMLMYRYHNLGGARAKAAANGYEGAQFPWESAGDGREVTPPWVPHFANPSELIRIWTGDIEIHITADIAYAILQFWRATGDDLWMRDYGAEIVLDGAKFWGSAVRLEADGKYHLRNVIGPDEYHDRIDDNIYTNYFARWHLEQALQIAQWLQITYPSKHGQLAESLNLTASRLEQWRTVADRIYLGRVDANGVMEQFDGFFALESPDFATLRDPGRTRSMQALLGIEGCALTQIIKQPDVLQLMYMLPDDFTPAQLRANYDYYDPRTDHEHGSSLGPSISAIMACRVGDGDGAYAHFMRAARADLYDVRHNAGDGIHAASAGGTWQAAVFGFAGLTLRSGGVDVQPQLPHHWTRLAFKVRYQGTLYSIDIHSTTASVTATVQPA